MKTWRLNCYEAYFLPFQELPSTFWAFWSFKWNLVRLKLKLIKAIGLNLGPNVTVRPIEGCRRAPAQRSPGAGGPAPCKTSTPMRPWYGGFGRLFFCHYGGRLHFRSELILKNQYAHNFELQTSKELIKLKTKTKPYTLLRGFGVRSPSWLKSSWSIE